MYRIEYEIRFSIENKNTSEKVINTLGIFPKLIFSYKKKTGRVAIWFDFTFYTENEIIRNNIIQFLNENNIIFYEKILGASKG